MDTLLLLLSSKAATQVLQQFGERRREQDKKNSSFGVTWVACLQVWLQHSEKQQQRKLLYCYIFSPQNFPRTKANIRVSPSDNMMTAVVMVNFEPFADITTTFTGLEIFCLLPFQKLSLSIKISLNSFSFQLKRKLTFSFYTSFIKFSVITASSYYKKSAEQNLMMIYLQKRYLTDYC